MSTLNRKRLFQLGLSASLFAFILLIVMVALPWPFSFAFPGMEVLSGSIVLSENELEAYITAMRINYAVDEIFIVCWILGWSALCLRISADSNLTPIVLALGLIGPLLDFSENRYIWQLLTLLANDSEAAQITRLAIQTSWETIRHLSYVIPFSATLLLLSILYIQHKIGVLILGISFLATSIAILGLYLPALQVATYVWWLLFFLMASYLNWNALGD